MTDPSIALTHISFTEDAAGILQAPAGAAVAFAPIGGAFLELRIVLANGATVTAVLARNALKIHRAEVKQ